VFGAGLRSLCSNHLHFITALPLPLSRQLHHTTDNTPKAIEVLSTALNAHPALADDEATNLLAELYIVSKKFQEAYDVSASIRRAT